MVMSHDQHLVGSGCQQLGLDGGGMGGLAAALAGLARGAQQPVEGGLRAEVGALVQQGWPRPRPGPGQRTAAQCRASSIAARSAGASARGWARSRCGTGSGRGGAGLLR